MNTLAKCLFVVYLLLTSCGALAQEWCPNPSRYENFLRTSGISFGPYPTDITALQAAVDAYQYGSNRRTTVISCNGQGVCTTCFSWTPYCNNNSTVWNGYDDFLNRRPGSDSLILPCDCRMVSSYMLSNYAEGRTTCNSPLSITLSGGNEIEPSNGSDKKFLPFVATVKDQNGQPPTTPVTVKISLKVDPASGGHDHGDSARPRGGIDGAACTSDSTCRSYATSGTVTFSFDVPEASGTHTITATCDRCTNNPQTAPVNVKVAGLSGISSSQFYSLTEPDGTVIGARLGWHTDNHNLNADAQAALLSLAEDYHRIFPNSPVLNLNDASLPWGGVYDICVRPGACATLGVVPWKKPHAEHRRGTVIDIRANNAAGAIPPANQRRFQRLVENSGMSFLHESQGLSNEHYHVRLLGRSE